MTRDAFHFTAKSQKTEIATTDDNFDFTVMPASTANAIPVDLELVLLNDVSGNVSNSKYDLTAVQDGDRTDFAEATTELTSDYIL